MSAHEMGTRRGTRWSLDSVRSRVEAGSAADWRIAVAKRALDLVVSAVLLALLLPFIVVLAILVRLDSPGPVFYRCDRVGYRGRPLRMIKFRKMVCDAAGPPLTKADDQRFTRIGRSLARYKLDELPQLWHVFRGEMSLVGPRPESPEFVERYAADYYGRILTVKPGISVTRRSRSRRRAGSSTSRIRWRTTSAASCRRRSVLTACTRHARAF